MLQARFFRLGQDLVVAPVDIVVLTPNGQVYIPDTLKDTLASTKVFAPDGSDTVLTPADGEAYVRALPSAFRGTYFWAELKD